MSDDGDRICPLCAEEMDLTDQQLKPCKCGYEICVWCWHQINDMAEKEETEGRCPACRTPYDKERIVRMAADCERLVAEINAEKKQKSQRSKLKISTEAKKHFSSVRVIQRNLVYIIGLPTNLCDESILERKEYFGQYGKVIKVSLSRSGSAPSQQTTSNNTFNVYVTYAREEDAVRCIQAVHNYVLEGKTLRACFGTTKYCHAWLRNMPCSNSDCLYLHDIGCQEDSFTKDEVISAYTRSRVPQVVSTNAQQRTGKVLPPPADDLSSSSTSSGRNNIKSASNVKAPNNIGKSTVLPASASWGLRSSNCRPPTASATCTQLSRPKQKLEMVDNLCLPPVLTETKYPSAWNDEVVSIPKVTEIQTPSIAKYPSLLMENTKQSSWHSVVDITPKLPESGEALQSSAISQPLNLSIEVGTLNDRSSTSSSWSSDVVLTSMLGGERKMVSSDDRFRQLENQKPAVDKQSQTPFSDVSSVDVSDIACSSPLSSNISYSIPSHAPEDTENFIHVSNDNTKLATSSVPKGIDGQLDNQGSDSIEGVTNRLCLSLSLLNKDIHDRIECLSVNKHHFSDSESSRVNLPMSNGSNSPSLNKALQFVDKHSDNELQEQNFELLKMKSTFVINSKDDSYDNEVRRDMVADLSSSPQLSQLGNHGNSASSTYCNKDIVNKQISRVGRNMDRELEIESFLSGDKEYALSNGHKDNEQSSSSSRMVFTCPDMNCNEEKAKSFVQVDDFVSNNKCTGVDLRRESNIISNILSLDVDPWDDSLNTVNGFAKLIGGTERQENSLNLLSLLKASSSNQSRFSFARQESNGNLVQPIKVDGYAQKFCSSLNDSYNDHPYNGILYDAFEAHSTGINNNCSMSSSKAASNSKSKIPAPPGFLTPNKAPPPGFSSHDILYQKQEAVFSDNHLLHNRVGNHYQAHIDANPSDVEFIDPAILAVGKGRTTIGINNSSFGVRPTFPSQISSTDPRLLLKQHSLSYKNLSLPDSSGDRFLPIGDAYFTSRPSVENNSSQSPITQMSLQQLGTAQFLNQQWDGSKKFWSTGSNMVMRDLMRNEIFGRNFYPTNDEQNIYFPNGDLYNRDFKITSSCTIWLLVQSILIYTYVEEFDLLSFFRSIMNGCREGSTLISGSLTLLTTVSLGVLCRALPRKLEHRRDSLSSR